MSALARFFNDRFISRWVFDVELIARYIRQVGSPEAAARRIYELPLRAWADIGFVAFWDVVKIRYTYLSRGTQRTPLAAVKAEPWLRQ